MAAIIEVASSNSSTKPDQTTSSSGLTSDEARSRLQKDGSNAMPDVSAHPLRHALAKFWAPVPWLLEASIVLEVVLHKYFEACGYCGPAGLQRSTSVFPGRSRPGYFKGIELASRLECLRGARWCMEDGTGREVSARRSRRSCRSAAWLRRMYIWSGDLSCSINPCSQANLCPLKLVQELIPTREHWYGVVKQPQK